VITAAQIRATRALLGMDQRALAEASSRGHVDSLMKPITALDAAGFELINEGAPSQGGGRGVRLKA
jgi:hypothetical protein